MEQHLSFDIKLNIWEIVLKIEKKIHLLDESVNFVTLCTRFETEL